MASKKCVKCGKRKPLSEYHSAKGAGYKDGHRNDCKVCRRKMDAARARQRWKNDRDFKAKRLARAGKHYQANKPRLLSQAHDNLTRTKYGMSYSEAIAEFGDKCCICGRSEGELPGTRIKKLCIDHCHRTGVVRGLLCITCNTALGAFGDDENILERALIYLEGSRSS